MNNKLEFQAYLNDLDKNVRSTYETAINLSNLNQYVGLKNDLFEALTSIIGFHSVHFCGSRVRGLAVDSNLKVIIKMDDMSNKPKICRQEMAVTLVETFQLYKFSKKFKMSELYPNKFIPICKVLYKPLAVEVILDYSYSDILELESDKIINYWMSMHDDQIRRFTLLVKSWFNLGPINIVKFNLDEVLCILCIFYFQQADYIPSYQELSNFINVPVPMNGKNVAYRDLIPLDLGKNDLVNYKTEIIKFFDYYANFKFDTNVICPYVGKIVAKIELQSTECLQHQRLKLNYICHKHYNNPMIVLGFLEFGENFASQIDRKTCDLFLKFCKDSAIFLRERSFLLE